MFAVCRQAHMITWYNILLWFIYILEILSQKENWQPEEKLANIINIEFSLIPYLCLAIKIKRHWSYSLIYSSSFQKPGYISSSFPEEVSIIISLCCLISIKTGHVSRGINFTFYLVVFILFYVLPDIVVSVIKLFSEKQIL